MNGTLDGILIQGNIGSNRSMMIHRRESTLRVSSMKNTGSLDDLIVALGKRVQLIKDNVRCLVFQLKSCFDRYLTSISVRLFILVEIEENYLSVYLHFSVRLISSK